MTDAGKLMSQEPYQSWIKTTLKQGVRELTRMGLFDDVVVQAKPAWAFPGQILIGKIRGRGNLNEFYWFICGNLPTDCLASNAAVTPRDAARHFSLKWQLDAEKKGLDGEELARQAEGLYELADEPGLWDENVT